ncbi:hypothetical protein AAC86_01180 [Salmonella enterica subsp. enterica]|nr:hypothetical protein [Salmonella enterica subsp. enterica]
MLKRPLRRTFSQRPFQHNVWYIMRTMMMENGKQPPSVNQSYNQRPALADAMSIPIVNSGA